MGDGSYDSVEVKKNINWKPVKGTEDEKECTCCDSKKNDENSSVVFDDKTNGTGPTCNEEESVKDFCEDVKPSVFEVLRSLDCDSSYFCGEIRDDNYYADVRETDVNSVVGKRNRQDSCNSAANDCSNKANKKSRKKHIKKQELDDEIEKILADIEMVGKAPLEKSTDSNNLLSEKKIKSTENILQNEKVTKKKKKNKKNLSQSTENVEPVDEISAHKNLNIGPAPKKKERKQDDEKEISELFSAACEKPRDNVYDDSLDEEKTAFSNGKKDRKRPGKKQIAAIQAQLQKAKEEEEKLKREELTKQRRAEEAEKLRLEKLKLEEERKLKKKQKEKERKERLKAEGKFLNKTQKLMRARNEATILAWREHGIDIPNVGEKRTGPETKNNYRRKHNSKFSNTDDERPSSVTISASSLENVNVDDSAESASSSHNWAKKSQLSMKVKSLSESSDSNFILNKHFHSDVSLHTSDSVITNNSSLPKSQSLHCIKEHSKIRCTEFIAESTKDYSNKYRSPVVCVLGHVDTGKTKILDHIRKTHVQASEAGGITQQIGATMVPYDALKEKCKIVKSFSDFELKLPGLLIIDTPGHESFRNLRSRGSSLCDIAILVVDIMHGLQQQTIESLSLLKQRKTPFVVALNKIDRIYGWKSSADADVKDVITSQNEITRMEFEKRYKQLVLEFANERLNVALFYDNPDPRSYVSLIPVSAITGDGMGNVLAFLCQLTQNMMLKRLTFSEDLEATVLEVKTTAGLGTTIDVILVNGRLKEGDTIVLAGQEGPVVSQIRSLLMPQPLKELRVKNPYVEYKEVRGAQGVKVSGRELDKVIAGLPLYVARCQDEVLAFKEKVSSLLRCAMNSVKLSERGVYVQASTLGSLEALLEFLKSCEIPYAGVKVGPVVKKDVIKASVMLEHDIQYAVILAFDVKIERDAQELAENLGIKIFQADIIYHLFDNFIEFREKLLEKRKNEAKKLAVFPCKLRIIPESIFNIRDPIVLGVRVEAGVLKVGTPLCVPSKNALFLGCVANIEVQHQTVESAKTGDEVCIKIEPVSEESSKIYGRHFNHEDFLVSRINRQTIDACKEFYRKDLTKSDWQLVVELKKLLHVT